MHTAFDWNTLYLTCFVLGLVLSVIAFLTGAMHLHIGHFHFGHSHHGMIGKNAAHHSLGFLNGFTLMAFLTWFGAAGYLLNRYGWFAAPAILGFAILGGLGGACIIWLFLTKGMMKRSFLAMVWRSTVGQIPGFLHEANSNVQDSSS